MVQVCGPPSATGALIVWVVPPVSVRPEPEIVIVPVPSISMLWVDPEVPAVKLSVATLKFVSTVAVPAEAPPPK